MAIQNSNALGSPNSFFMKIKILLIFLGFMSSSVFAQDGIEYKPIKGWDLLTSEQQLEKMRFTTPTYRRQVLQLVLGEANKAASELSLEESTPINQGDISAMFVSTPCFWQMYGALGNISTTNYTYFVSQNSKLSSIVRTHHDDELVQLVKKHHWPMWKVDTNAAYQLAVELLTKVHVDVAKLNRNCRCEIYYPHFERKYFTPNYSVVWTQGESSGCHAQVEVFMPTKTLRDLSVNRSEYILRPPLGVTNLDYLLSQTNTAVGTNAPGSP
jgi:hypothetical protein